MRHYYKKLNDCKKEQAVENLKNAFESTEKASAFLGCILKISQKTEVFKELDIVPDGTLIFVKEVDSEAADTITTEKKIDAEYHVIKDKIFLNVETKDPEATLLHELRHKWQFENNKDHQWDRVDMENDAEEWASEAALKYFNIKYEPVIQQKKTAAHTLYCPWPGASYPAIAEGNQLHVFNDFGTYMFSKSLHWDYWTGKYIAV